MQAIREYRLACEMVHDNQTVMVSLRLAQEESGTIPGSLVIAIPFLALIGGMALLWGRNRSVLAGPLEEEKDGWAVTMESTMSEIS